MDATVLSHAASCIEIEKWKGLGIPANLVIIKMPFSHMYPTITPSMCKVPSAVASVST